MIDSNKLPAAAVEVVCGSGRGSYEDERLFRIQAARFLNALLADDEVMRSLVERYQGVMIGFNDPRVRRMRAALTAVVQEER